MKQVAPAKHWVRANCPGSCYISCWLQLKWIFHWIHIHLHKKAVKLVSKGPYTLKEKIICFKKRRKEKNSWCEFLLSKKEADFLYSCVKICRGEKANGWTCDQSKWCWLVNEMLLTLPQSSLLFRINWPLVICSEPLQTSWRSSSLNCLHDFLKYWQKLPGQNLSTEKVMLNLCSSLDNVGIFKEFFFKFNHHQHTITRGFRQEKNSIFTWFVGTLR